MKLFTLVFSAEFFFAAFLLAGYFKGGITWFPVDITLFCLFITAILALFRVYKKARVPKQAIIAVGIFLVFSICILISYLITDSVVYANEKIIRFFVITTWSFIGVFLLIINKKSLEKFIKGVILIALIVSTVGIIDLIGNFKTGTYNGTIFIMNTDYLALGRTVGLGLILLIAYSWFKGNKPKVRTTLIILGMFCVVLFSGGRMPLISLICSLVIIMLVTTRFTVKRNIKIRKGSILLTGLIMLGVVALLPIYLNGAFNDIFWRISSFFSGNDESSIVRIQLYSTALKMILENPLIGTGWGSFPLYYYGLDYKVYPHNIFLEIFAELGLVGTVLFISLMGYALYNGIIKFNKRFGSYNNIQLALIGGFVFFLLNANTSGDITDNKILLTFIALLTISPTINKDVLEGVSINAKKLKRKAREQEGRPSSTRTQKEELIEA